MGLRFWRRSKIAPDVRVFLSERGAPASLGPRAAKLSLGPRGVRYIGGSLGMGSAAKRGKRGRAGRSAIREPACDDLDISFFEKIAPQGAEVVLIAGLRAMREGSLDAALRHLSKAQGLADAAYMAAVITLQVERYEETLRHLDTALAGAEELGSVFRRLGFDVTVELPIAEGYAELVGPDIYGATLMLVEVCHKLDEPQRAIAALEALRAKLPGSVTLALALAELHMDSSEPQQALNLLADRSAPEPLLTPIRIYRGRALRALGSHAKALEALVVTSREVKRIPGALARNLRYERALTLEALGRSMDARSELQIIHAEDPHYEDVAERLGLK